VEELVEDSFNRPVEVKIHTSIKPRETPPLRQVTDSPSNSWTPSPIQNKRKAENLDPLETMSLFKRVRLMQRPYKDSSRDPTSKSIVTLPAEIFVKLQRVFEWVSQSLIYWEDVYDERRQNDFSKSLERQQALHFASFHGDLSAVQDLIDQGVDVNEWASWKRDTDSGKVYEDRFTAIEAAASNGHRHVVKLLLERGANPCLGEIVWGSPLVIAARRHDLELATILMDCGADVNQESVYSYSSGQTMTALQRACCEGDLNMVTLLLSRGAKPNAPGGHYGPALLAATIGENPLLVDRLLEAGADINAVHQIGPKANSGRRQQTALVRAILNNHLSVVRLLLERGADIYVDCECGNAIQNAAFFGREEIIDELIMRGADVYRPSMSFNTVLEAAAAGQQHKLFRRFIAFGMDIYAPCVARINPFYVSPRSSATGSNLLYVAAESGANEIVSFLLDKGMDVNVRGGEYECALIAAVSRGHTITTRLLLEKGANFAILSPSPSHGGTSALYHAVIHGDCDIIQLLLDAGAPINDINGKYGSVLQLAALNTPESVAHLLLDRGIDVNLQGGYFGNALQAWSYVGNHEIVKILLAKGADPLAIGGFYGSAMAAAVHDNHLPVIQLLQEYGAPLPPRSAGSSDFSRSLYTQKSTKVSTKGQVGE
jgi:ankyrin repeat protein